MKVMESHETYLGLPSIIGKSKSQIFSYARDKVWKKLNGWKERTLLRVGREVLIKVVAQAILTYVMGCFSFPISLCDQIESMVSRSYWSGKIVTRKIHWLTWAKLSQQKARGRLGFQNFEAFNTTFLAKQWWSLSTRGKDSLLYRIRCSRCGLVRL